MSTKTKVANKTQWALEDVVAICRNSDGDMKKLMRIAEQRSDPALALLLARLIRDFADIEMIARAARRGEYDKRRTQRGDEEEEEEEDNE